MKKSSYIILVALLVICLNSCLNSAEQEDSGKIIFNQVDETLIVESSFVFNDKKSLEISLPEDFRGLSANTPYKISDKNLIISGKQINFSYITNEYLNSGKNYEFLYKLTIPYDLSKLTLVLNLDRGFIVDSKDIFPHNVIIKSDGRTISLNWDKENLTEGDTEAFFVIFSDTKKENKFFYYVILLGLSVLLGIFIYILSIKNKAKRSFENHLNENEKKIIKELRLADRNELWQKQLQIKTEFSKAKLSRIIRDLEARNLIKKIPFGNTNKVILR